jgi:tetratricopeptide (TPR) repeat protein
MQGMERYSLLRELGAGASARVFLALDTQQQRLVALKQLHANIAFAGSARMKREFRALSSLKHQNIVSVLDYGERSGAPYLALEYIEGITLHTWLEQQPDLTAVVAVFAQLCDALSVVHQAGLLHRDLKPENVMLTQNKTVKLMDFGLSKAGNASLVLTREGAMVGTVLYMSPEQCRGADLDPRSDLYSLGVMLYQALTGRLPFYSDSLAEVLLLHLQATPRNPKEHRGDIPTHLETLVLHLLSKDPSQRPPSAEAVAAILRGQQAKSRGNQAQLLSAPMIGRANELATLRRALMPPHSLVALLGEAGMGKTRLLRELEAATGGVWLTLVWLENDPPGTWFERLVGLLTTHQPEVFWGLSDRARAGMALVRANNDLERLARFEALRELLGESRAILVFEDLHFASPEDLHWLGHGLRGAAVRAVLSYRPEDLGFGFERHLPPMDCTVRLQPLPPEAALTLIEARLGAPVEARLRDVLLERSGGNPWLLEERLQTMLVERQLVERDGMFEWTRQPTNIPENVAEVLEKRLGSLLPQTLAFAQASAVLGTQFDFDDAKTLLGWDDDPAIAALEDMIRARLLIELPGSDGNGYRFTHPEYTSQLRSSLPPDQAQALHAKAALVLVRHASEVELAEHHLIAQNHQHALELGLLGGERALKNLHYAFAERGFRAALESNSTPSPLRARATFGLAETLRATGHIAEAERHYREVLYHAQPDLEAKTRLRLAEILTARGEPIRALEVLARSNGAEVLLARARVALAITDVATARHHALKAWAEVKGFDPELELEVLLLLGQIALTLGQYNRTLLLTTATQSRVRRENQLLWYLQLRRLEANAYMGKRQWSRALEVHAEISQEATRVGHLELQVFSLNNTGVILTLEDEVETALQRFTRAMLLAKRADDRELENIAAENAVLCQVMLGQLEAASSLAQRFDTATMLIWRSRVANFLGQPTLALPPLELVPAWQHGLYALAQIEALLLRRQYATVLRAAQAPRQDYLWFWALYETVARIGLKMEHKEHLTRLARPLGDCGIKRSLAREQAVLLRDFLQHQLSPEAQQNAISGLLGVALRALA